MIIGFYFLFFHHFFHFDGDLLHFVIHKHLYLQQTITKLKPLSHVFSSQLVNILIKPSHTFEQNLQLCRKIFRCKLRRLVNDLFVVVYFETYPHRPPNIIGDESVGVNLKTNYRVIVHNFNSQFQLNK